MKKGIVAKVVKKNVGKLSTGETVLSCSLFKDLQVGSIVEYTEEIQTMAFVKDELGEISYTKEGVAKLKTLPLKEQIKINKVVTVFDTVEEYVAYRVALSKYELLYEQLHK